MIAKTRRYEILFLLSSREEVLRKELEDIREIFNKKKITISREFEMGVKKLAYPIKNQTKGHYHAFYFEADTQLIKETLAEFRFREAILRSMLLELEKRDWDFLAEDQVKKQEEAKLKLEKKDAESKVESETETNPIPTN